VLAWRYNIIVEKYTSLRRVIRHILILVGLSVLIIAPSLLVGWEDLRLAERAMGEGRFAAAASDYSAAARLLPWQPALWERAAQAALASGHPQAAIPLFERAGDKKALSLQGWLAWGNAYQQSGDIASALTTWQAGIEQYGSSAAVYARLAQAYNLQGDYPAAITAWSALLDLDEGNADAHFRLGLLLAATTPELALPELMQAARLDPGMDATVQGLRASLNAALLVDNRPYQLLISGRALAALGEWELAAEAFRRVVAARPDYAEAWAWLGEAHQHLGADGLPDLQRALLLDPDSPGVNALVGLYWQRQGQAGQALAYFRKAMRLEPGNAAWRSGGGAGVLQAGGRPRSAGRDLLALAGVFLRPVPGRGDRDRPAGRPTSACVGAPRLALAGCDGAGCASCQRPIERGKVLPGCSGIGS